MNVGDVEKDEIVAALHQLLSEREEMAREARRMIGETLKGAPMRWVERRGALALRADIAPETMEELRALAELVTGLDDWVDDDERLLGLLALAVLRDGRFPYDGIEEDEPPPT